MIPKYAADGLKEAIAKLEYWSRVEEIHKASGKPVHDQVRAHIHDARDSISTFFMYWAEK